MKLHHRIKTHLKNHHKKYVGWLFAGFAVVKTLVLLSGFLGFVNLASTFADEITLQERYFDQNSTYTVNRTGNDCDPQEMNVVHVSPGTNTIPHYLAEDTLYVLNSWSYTISSDYIYPSHCSALIGSGDVTIYSDWIFNRTIFFSEATNNIVDNIIIDGIHNADGTTHGRNFAGIQLYVSSNNTINNSRIFNNRHGIKLEWSANNNTINNIEVYDNSSAGFHISDSTDTSISGAQIYNSEHWIFLNAALRTTITNVTSHDNVYGIYWNVSHSTTINNSHIYDNNQDWIKLENSNYATISGSQVYHNSAYWMNLKTANNSIISNVQVYNNQIWLYLYDGSRNNTLENSQFYNNNNGIYITNGTNTTINNSQFYNNNIHGIRFEYTANITINNSQIYNNGNEWISIYQWPNTTINNCQSYNNAYWINFTYSNWIVINNSQFYNNYVWVYGYYQWSVNGKYYGTLKVFGNDTNLSVDDQLPAWDDSEFFSWWILDTEWSMSCDWITNPMNADEIFLIDEVKNPTCNQRWTIGSRSGSQNSYLYGSNIRTQKRVILDSWTTNNSVFSWSNAFDPNNYIAEVNLLLNWSLLVASGQTYTLDTGIQVKLTLTESADYVLSGNFIWAPMTGTLSSTETKNITLTPWYGTKYITVTYSTWSRTRTLTKSIGYPDPDGLPFAYFSSWSAYTKNRSSNTCNPGAMTVEYLNPGTDTIPENLSTNTFYILLSWSYTVVTDGRWINVASCSALIGSGDVTIYSQNQLDRMVLIHDNNNTIIDNLTINGTYGHQYSRNHNWISLDNANNNTINAVEIYGNDQFGMLINNNSTYNTITNSQVQNNASYGIDIYDNSDNTTISNSQIYNNNDNGIHIQDTDYTTIDNSQIYNNSSNGICLNYANNNTTISNSQVYMNSNNGIDVYYSNNTLINNSQVYNNNGYGIFIHDFSNGTTINSIQSYNNGGYGMYNWHSSPTTYYGTIKLFSNNEGNNIYDPNNQVVAWDGSEFFSGWILDEAVIAMSCDWVTNPINTDGMFLMTTACDQHQKNWNRSSEADTKYLYGSNILKQTQAMEATGNNGTPTYAWWDLPFNTTNYIAETNPILNGSLLVASGQNYILETGVQIQITVDEPADYVLSGDFVWAPITGTLYDTATGIVYLSEWYGIKSITVIYSTGNKERSITKHIGYISSIDNYCELVTDISRTQCDALVALYNSTNGSGWYDHNNWLGDWDTTPTTACDWEGVYCTEGEWWEEVYYIDIEENNLSGIIPAQISGLSSLRYLYLNGNQITTIASGAFNGLSNLQYLYLNNNQITTIASGAFNGLSRWNTLNLSNNQITTIASGAFNELPELQYLYLDHNKIASITTGMFDGISSVQEIRLNNNMITTIVSDAFSWLSNLYYLYINNNNIATIASGAFNGLSNLPYLSLSYNNIATIASGAFNGLSNCWNLFLDHNKITSETIASGVFNGFSSLEELGLDNNFITTVVSGTFNGLVSLKYLYLDNNQIVTIANGAFNGLSRLSTLNIYNNQIANIASGAFNDLSNISYLDLDNNQLVTIATGAFNWLSNLDALYINNNHITSIDANAFDGIPNVERLSINHNAVTSIGSGAFKELPNLQELNLSNNLITNIRNIALNWLSTLPYLNLSYNQITSITSGAFNGLSRWNTLNLTNNQITTIGSWAFSELPELQYLYLGYNQIGWSLDIFCPLTQLNWLYVSNNRFAGDIPLCLTNLTYIWNRGGGDISYNYLNVDVEYPEELLNYLQDNYRFWRTRNVQYRVADLSLTWTMLSLWENTFRLNLWYYNAWLWVIDNTYIQYDMVDGMDIETDTEYSTGKVGAIYGGLQDSCFADMYNNGQWAYFDRMEAYIEDEGSDNLADWLNNRREGWYNGSNTGAGKARADYIINDYDGDPVNRAYEFDDYFNMDITNIPGCGTGWKNVYTFNIGTLDVWESGAILITGMFSNHLKNNGFSNKTEILSSNGLRIDGATWNNTFWFTYNDGNIVIDTIQFIPVTPTIPTTNPAIWGGGWSWPSRDSCPVQRDCSDSYYDRLCGPCPLIDKKPVHKSPDKVPGSITGSKLSTELKDAYKRAYGYDITTMDTIQKANMNGPLLRKDMAKMISNFATNIMNKDISTWVRCEFDDMRNLPKETQYYAIAACRLWLMWYESDGIRTKHTFDPEQIVDRAQFGTILSRLIRGEKNNGGDIYYQKHLDALKQGGIMNNITRPLATELRGRVMVMMKRVFDKK